MIHLPQLQPQPQPQPLTLSNPSLGGSTKRPSRGVFFDMHYRHFNLYLVGQMLILLAGCEGFNPVTDTAAHFIRNSKVGSKAEVFSPGFEYLEVEWQGRISSMALGYRNTNDSLVTEHWYSGHGEMVKLVNGRIVQVLGMTNEVRSSVAKAPEWSELLSHRFQVVWVQTKDAMPLYRYGLQEFVISRQVSPTKAETNLAPSASNWVLEEVKGKKLSGSTWIYEQKFALTNNTVIYSEQCVAPSMCFKLKPLGVVVPR